MINDDVTRGANAPQAAHPESEPVLLPAAESAGQPTAYRAHWAVPASLPWFEGHFPGMPVLPAVALLETTLATLRRALGQPGLELVELAQAKFTQPITPGLKLELTLTAQADPAAQAGPRHWRATWADAETGKSLAELGLRVRDRDV